MCSLQAMVSIVNSSMSSDVRSADGRVTLLNAWNGEGGFLCHPMNVDEQTAETSISCDEWVNLMGKRPFLTCLPNRDTVEAHHNANTCSVIPLFYL